MNLFKKTFNLLLIFFVGAVFFFAAVLFNNGSYITRNYGHLPERSQPKPKYFGDEHSEKDLSCYGEPGNDESVAMLLDKEVAADKSIFFHETSCFGESGAILNPRQACAVESAAKMNPDRTVYLLFLSPSKLSTNSKLLYDQLTSYKNVKIRRIFVNDYIKNTSLEEWYTSGAVKTSLWPTITVSDFIRYLTLWKFGGTYLDLDVVVMKSLQNLTNYVGAEDWSNIAAGVMGFSSSGSGHEIVTQCLLELQRNFHGNIWGNTGPGVITRTLRKICNEQNIQKMTPEKCKGFHVFPPSVFYPIHYNRWKQFFQSANFKLIENATAIHVWNKLSKHEPIRIGDNTLYSVVAQKYCPKVYSSCETTF